MFYVWSILCLAGFILVHLSSKYMTFFSYIPRSKLLSAAGGVSVAYVFVHILPELQHHQQQFNQMSQEGTIFSGNHVYVMAFIGLAVFYGLERMVKLSKDQSEVSDYAGVQAFWVHMSSFFLYNALIAYLLIRGEGKDVVEMLLFFLAMSVHFITNDHALRENHQEVYDHYGRWLLAGGIILGGLVGEFVTVPEQIIALLFSFLAGSVLLNVLKEELPEERSSSFWAFILGGGVYTALLLLV
ncbi:hypothetical protein ACFOGI_06940 [Virgibacillus xinjiangensis]|uniref:ZIP Zinc transporter n=1 Tax=Virgibacillus xinjiangensis TaxID=393090 RepID=A0ABV7CUF4_9BACI